MAPQPKSLLPVSDETRIDCPVILSVRCIRKGHVYEHYEAYAKDAIEGLDLSTVGTHLQRTVYEGLRRAFADAINERNAVGEVDEEIG